MIIKTIKTTVNVLVGISVSSIAVMFAVLAALILHLLFVYGMCVYHLMHS
jgi:hypothetical protein